MAPKSVFVVRGRNLGRLYDWFHQHKIALVMPLDRDRDFALQDEPVVTSIDIEEITEPGQSQ